MEIKSSEPGSEASAKIVFRSGSLRGSVLALERERISIGRDQKNDIAINDDIISSYHASIIREPDGTYWLEDNRSKNGTFLRGRRIQREQLKDGDIFCLCQTGPEIQFTLGEPSLPSILGSTTHTFFRTKSVGQALHELWPKFNRQREEILSLTGVRKILDYKLEEATRRSRLLFLSLAGTFSLLTAAALFAIVYLTVIRGDGAALQPGGPGFEAGGNGPQAAGTVKLLAKLEPIYGSLFLSYRDHPIGKVEVVNDGESQLSGCEMGLSFLGQASRFLVEPWSAPVPEISPQNSHKLPVTPKLSTEVLSDQTREVTAKLSLLRDGEVLAEVSQAIFIHGRHIFSWERPERVAAFVDQNDPAVTSFVRSVWICNPAMGQRKFPPPNIVGALTLLTGISELGLSYLPDPVHPISEHVDWKANDSLNYPGETLLERSGDCDDLSILCCAVLEAARIPAALAAGSGHVLFLFDSGIRADDLPQTPLNPETVVVWKGRVWLPVESTEFAKAGSSFSSAWSAAWPRCKAMAAGEMRIIDLREAWRKYYPMNPPPTETTRKRIAEATWASNGLRDRVEKALEKLQDFFSTHLDRRVEEIRKVHGSGLEGDLAVGLLYTKSGLFNKARRIYERAVFGVNIPAGVKDLESWNGKITEEKSILLSNLSICLTQERRSREDLNLAAAYQELAIQGLPEEAEFEKGEMMLRLALIHRLRGDLQEERLWCAKAFDIDLSLDSTYRNLIDSTGPLSGPEEKVLRFLLEGIR